MKIADLADSAAEQLAMLICESADDIAALETRCAQEAQKKGKPVPCSIGFTLRVDGQQAVLKIAYGLRVSREAVFALGQTEIEFGRDPK